jgi:hypothetical protein
VDFKEIVPERFKARHDSKTDCFYILDTWHPQVMNLPNLEEEIPEESPAMKVLSGAEINAIIAEMKRIGYLDKIIKVNSDQGIIKEETAQKLLKRLDGISEFLSLGKAKIPVEKAEKKKRDRIILLNP